MASKSLTYGMSTNLLQHGPNWKSQKYRIEWRNDELGVIKGRTRMISELAYEICNV